MTSKTELFAELNDKENRVNPTAHIAVYKDGNGNTSVIVRQHSAPNIWLSNHKSDATTAAAVAKYTAWLNEWVAAQAEAAQARADLLAEIEADHAEGEAVVAAINNEIAAGIAHAAALEEDRQRQIEADRAAGRPVDEEGNDLREWCGNDIQAAHAEALELNELRDFRIDTPEPAQVVRTAAITARLQSHIIAPVFILLMLLIGGSFNADAAEPVEHWVCGGQQVSYDGKSLTVDGWRFTRPLEVVKKQPSVTRAVGFENTNRQIVMLITIEGTTIFAGDYYPEVKCIK